MVCESYHPTPTMVPYRGTSGTLFKRDFAGELMDAFGLALVDYRFVYRRDRFPLDDCT
jgi:spore coat polysaccharide biosynthesis protein SpsF